MPRSLAGEIFTHVEGAREAACLSKDSNDFLYICKGRLCCSCKDCSFHEPLSSTCGVSSAAQMGQLELPL